VSGIQTSLASVIVRYLIFSAEEKDRKKRDYFLQERERFFSFFQLNYHFLVKRTSEEESGMIHPEGLTIKKM